MMRRGFVLFLGLALALATLGAWLYSLLAPEKFGLCHSIALYVGHNATVRECQPYEATAFAVPVGLIAIVVPFMLYLVGDTDVEFPLFGKRVLVTRRGKVAEGELSRAVPNLAQRGDEWLDILSEEESAQ